MKIYDTKPTGFGDGQCRNLWIVDDRVAIFNIDHAKIVFEYAYNGLQIWGIKGSVANLLNLYNDAVDFFKE